MTRLRFFLFEEEFGSIADELVAETATQAVALDAVLIVELDKPLAISCILRDYPESSPILDDSVGLRTNLFHNINGCVGEMFYLFLTAVCEEYW